MIIDFPLPVDKKYHQYCLSCHSEDIHRVIKNQRSTYRCSDCGQKSARLLVIDPKIIWWVDKNTKEYWHESAGVFLVNDERKILFFERLLYPFLYTIPAGHVDVNEDPEIAAERELIEETSLKTDSLKLFSSENVVGDKCRRGADSHAWHLYTARIDDAGNNIVLNDEGINAVWLTLEQAMEKDLLYPVRYFIEKYGEMLVT